MPSKGPIAHTAEMKADGGQADDAMGSVHVITAAGARATPSARGSRPASCAWDATNLIFAVGAQPIAAALETPRQQVGC